MTKSILIIDDQELIIRSLFTTGYADKDLEEQARKLESADFIYKPFDLSALADKTKEIAG